MKTTLDRQIHTNAWISIGMSVRERIYNHVHSQNSWRDPWSHDEVVRYTVNKLILENVKDLIKEKVEDIIEHLN
jgi:hypothetical protein